MLKKGGGESERIDLRAQVNFPTLLVSNLETQIRNADNKAIWAFSILGVGIGAVLARINSLQTNTVWRFSEHTLTSLLFVFLFAMALVSFTLIIRVIYPRLVKGKKGASVTYFSDVVMSSEKEYVKTAMVMTDLEIIEAIYKYAYALSKVVDAKYKILRRALILAGITLIDTIVVLILTAT
jgi:glucan phosphoethanolaminetransferase (alkaline phosphatase superfamily)